MKGMREYIREIRERRERFRMIRSEVSYYFNAGREEEE